MYTFKKQKYKDRKQIDFCSPLNGLLYGEKLCYLIEES